MRPLGRRINKKSMKGKAYDKLSEEFRNNPLFLRNQFQGIGAFEMPLIKKDMISLANIKLIGYYKYNSDN